MLRTNLTHAISSVSIFWELIIWLNSFSGISPKTVVNCFLFFLINFELSVFFTDWDALLHFNDFLSVLINTVDFSSRLGSSWIFNLVFQYLFSDHFRSYRPGSVRFLFYFFLRFSSYWSKLSSMKLGQFSYLIWSIFKLGIPF